jgi:hypothetical protein
VSIADIKTGGWAVGERLRSTQMNSARAELLKCIDGVGGGTYTPSATISIDDLTVGGTDRLKYGSRTVSGYPALYASAVGADWAFNTTDALWHTTATAGNNIWFPVKLPRSCTVTTVAALVQGAAGHAGLPAVMPTVQLFTRSVFSDTATAAGGATDTSASTGAYQAGHAITNSALSVSIDQHVCFVRVSNESGANALSGFKLLAIALSFTMTDQHEWPG